MLALAAETSAVVDHDDTDWASASETDPSTFSMSSLRVSDIGVDDSGPITIGGERHADNIEDLIAMFPTMQIHSLRVTLSKCKGDIARATDELLNRVFLDADGETEKSVDGFREELNRFGSVGNRRRRKKSAGLAELHSELPTSENSWARISNDITTLADALHLSRSSVGNAYHANGGALAPTLFSLLEIHSPADNVSPCEPEEFATMRTEFPEIAERHLRALLCLCGSNHQAAFAFADILRRTPLDPLAPQYLSSCSAAPRSPNVSDQENDSWMNVRFPLRPTHTVPSTNIYASAAGLASSNRTLRTVAFTQAAAHYRRSKSDRLMAGAALYYAELGREAHKKSNHYSNIAAEEMVEANSEDGMLDLHGVTVPQAVKIAREKTTEWWVKTGADENRARQRGRVRTPFRIITGMGRHSKDGEPRLFPAVSKMLIREKWRISVDEGQILVLGVKN